MALVMTSAPAVEPISVAEAKAHLRIDGDSEDVLIASLILTSRLHIEAGLGLALLTQGLRLILDRWPKDGMIRLPVRPIFSLGEIRVLGGDGAPTMLAAEATILDAAGNPPRLVANVSGWPQPGRPANGIEIDLVAGFGAAPEDVPAPIRQALLMLVAHWYEHRDPIEIGSPATAVPTGVSNLLKPYRVARL